MRNTTSIPRIVEDLMTNDMVTLTAIDTVDQARDLMLTMGIHGIPVISFDGACVGIVTSHDLVDDWSGVEQLGEVMTDTVISIDSKATLSEAAQLMKSELIHHLVVLNGRNPIGIITTYDLLDALLL